MMGVSDTVYTVEQKESNKANEQESEEEEDYKE